MDDEWHGSTGTVYDYGMRIYDTRIAKFLSVDPLTKSYPMLTPYQFASNTPIWAIDLDGEEAVVYIRDVEWGNKIQGLVAAARNGEIVRNEDIQKMVVEATYATINRDNPANAGLDPSNNWAAVDGPDGNHWGTKVYFQGEQIAFTPYYQGENVQPKMEYKTLIPNLLPNPNAPISRQIGSLLFNKMVMPTMKAEAGIMLSGVLGMAGATSPLWGGGLAFTKDAAEQLYVSEGKSWDVANSLISGGIGTLTFGKNFSFMQKLAVNASGDLLKSAIDLRYSTQSNTLTTGLKLNEKGAIEFGLRSTLGNGFRQLPATGALEKQVRSGIQTTIEENK